MITAKEARALYYKHKDYVKEAHDFVWRLGEKITDLAQRGKCCTEIEMPTNNIIAEIVINVLNVNGYGWATKIVNDKVILQIGW